jgi:predicted metal-dependent enzyme (double-stranded beta helix superfamily)
MAILYSPPSPAALAKLKAKLNLPSAKMAELFGSEEARTWRKYAGGERTVNAQTLFFAMALLELTPEEIERVLNRMRDAGAQIELSAPTP